MSYLSTIICEDCGEEIDRGLLSYCNHINSCKRNAPNSSIEKHKWGIEDAEAAKKFIEAKRKADAAFDIVYKQMTDNERNELALRSLNGYWDGDTVYMGMKQYRKVEDFKQQMIDKYDRR